MHGQLEHRRVDCHERHRNVLRYREAPDGQQLFRIRLERRGCDDHQQGIDCARPDRESESCSGERSCDAHADGEQRSRISNRSLPPRVRRHGPDCDRHRSRERILVHNPQLDGAWPVHRYSVLHGRSELPGRKRQRFSDRDAGKRICELRRDAVDRDELTGPGDDSADGVRG